MFHPTRCVPWRWLGALRLFFSAHSNSSASHWRMDARARTGCVLHMQQTWHALVRLSFLPSLAVSIRFIRIHHTIYSTAWNSPYAKWIPCKKSEKLSPYVIMKCCRTATARGTASHSKYNQCFDVLCSHAFCFLRHSILYSTCHRRGFSEVRRIRWKWVWWRMQMLDNFVLARRQRRRNRRDKQFMVNGLAVAYQEIESQLSIE